LLKFVKDNVGIEQQQNTVNNGEKLSQLGIFRSIFGESNNGNFREQRSSKW